MKLMTLKENLSVVKKNNMILLRKFTLIKQDFIFFMNYLSKIKRPNNKLIAYYKIYNF